MAICIPTASEHSSITESELLESKHVSMPKFHTNTSDSWEAMIAACLGAHTSIEFEEFIFDPDEIGHRFMDVFKKKAAEGVRIRLLLDWWGCTKLRRAKSALSELEAAGVQVRFFNPFSWHWFARLSPFPRDHRKLLIIDAKTAFAGGVCVYDEIKDWRDTMVEVSDGLVHQLSHIFERTWLRSGDNPQDVTVHPDFETHPSLSIFANAPDADEKYFTEELISQIHDAKHSINLETPYFTPGRLLMPALLDALERGVKVRIILSNYSKYQPYVVGKTICGELIKHGAEIYYYEPVMLHLKVMIIDDKWSAIGSCNLDGLSIHQNQEAMLVSNDSAFSGTLLSHFNEDMKNSVRFSYADWQSRSFSQKVMGYLLFPFRHYL